MKTMYMYNGSVITEGATINGLRITVLYDGTHARVVHADSTEKWVRLEDLNISVVDVPSHWFFNPLTCNAVAVGDVIGKFTCTRSGELPLFNRNGGRSSMYPEPLIRIPNPGELTDVPIPAGHRIFRGVPQIKIGARWVPTSRVGFHGSAPYDTDRNFIYAGLVHPVSDSVMLDGVRTPKTCVVSAVVDADGTKQQSLRNTCREVDGVWYHARLVWDVVDSVGRVVSSGTGEPPPDTVRLGCGRYAPLSIVRYCCGNDQPYLSSNGELWNGDWFSYDWLNDNTFVCECCEERYDDDESYSGRCADCDNDRLSSDGVRDYCDRSANNLRPEKDVPLKFGIELEVEAIGGRSESIAAFNLPDRYCVYKEDGSLGCGGYEIVTRPDCPSVHKRIFGEVLARRDVSATTRSWASGRCGIHIHVSRAPLSGLWLGRMLVLVNSEAMKPIVAKVAGRYSTTYSSIGRKKLTDGKKRGYSRYDALNTSGDNTIEFRLFRGTLSRDSFLKNIEFVEAVLAFCKPCTCSNLDVNNPTEFVSFLRKRRKEWPHLWSFLVVKGLAPKAIRA